MRYTVLTFRTFHHRITKYLGVLVGAALVAALGLPSAAQAQTPAAPTVKATTGAKADINVTWGVAPTKIGDDDVKGWRIEYKEPGEDAVALYTESAKTTLNPPLDADDPRIHHGIWQFRVSYWPDDKKPAEDKDVKPLGTPSAWASYHHGPPTAAPTGLTAYDAGPDARRLVWDTEKGLMYEWRYTADPTDDDEWTAWKDATSGDTITNLKTGTEYTFEVRGLGETRAGVGDLHGPSASTAVMMPVPTPTLPEIAALFLAMLLLGSGAYLLRGRQSGGLTPA